MRLLSDDEQSYFRDMESLFNHPGWERLMRELAASVERLPFDTFQNATSMDHVIAARARVAAIEELVKYPALVDLRRTTMEQGRLSQIADVNEL